MNHASSSSSSSCACSFWWWSEQDRRAHLAQLPRRHLSRHTAVPPRRASWVGKEEAVGLGRRQWRVGRREWRVGLRGLLRVLRSPPAYALLFGQFLPWRSVGGALPWRRVARKGSPRNPNPSTTLGSKRMRMQVVGSASNALSSPRAAPLLCSGAADLSQRVLPKGGGASQEMSAR